MENKSTDSVKKAVNKKETAKKSTVKKTKDMESRKKVFGILIVIIFILAIALVILPFATKNITENAAADKLAEEKTFQTYKVKETKISYEGDTTVFETKIENIGSDTIPAGGFNIILLDKEGTELSSIGVYLKEMEPAEVIETKAVIAEKVENIYDVKIIGDEEVVDEGTVGEEITEEELIEE